MSNKEQICLTGFNHLVLYNWTLGSSGCLQTRWGIWNFTLSSCTRTTLLKNTCQSVELSSSGLLWPPLHSYRLVVPWDTGGAWQLACFDGNFVMTHCSSCWAQKSRNFPRSGAMGSSLMWNKVSVMEMMTFLMLKIKGVQQTRLNLQWLHITSCNKTKIALSSESCVDF